MKFMNKLTKVFLINLFKKVFKKNYNKKMNNFKINKKIILQNKCNKKMRVIMIFKNIFLLYKIFKISNKFNKCFIQIMRNHNFK